jgi:hypothetical protein
MYRESQLIPLCDEVLRMMENGKLKSQVVSYIQSKRYPCSLFIAAWYMLRLGVLQSQDFDLSKNQSAGWRIKTRYPIYGSRPGFRARATKDQVLN